MTFKKIIESWKLLLLVLFLIVGVLLSKSPFAGFYGILKLLEFTFFGFYVSQAIKNKQQVANIAFIFSFGILFESFLAIAQIINNGSLNGIFYLLGERTFNAQTLGIANASINGELILRPYATFPHPNVLAGFLLIGMTFVISKIKDQRSKTQRIISVSSIGLGTIALFLTLSRVAIVLWVGIFIFSIFDYLKSIIKKDKKNIFPNIWQGSYYFLFSILFLSIIGVFFFSNIRYRFLDLNLNDESVVVRTELIKSSINMIKRSPIVGVGLNNFLINLPNDQNLKNQNIFTYLQPVHNIYLLIASQTGIIGFVIFVWFILKTFKNIQFQISNFKYPILVTILVLGLFDHYSLTLQQGQLLFSFVLGLCWAKYKI